ncbi:MAG: TolC family protein [Bacteroidales bacterium]|nr:TolC family protein [Bacteroidales bacterium]
MRLVKFLPFLAFFFTLFAGAQEAELKFSLNGALEYALQHNKTLQNAKNDVELSTEQFKEARAAGLPQVDGSVDYMTNFNYEFEFAFGGEATAPDIDYDLLDAGDYEVLNFIGQAFGSSGSTIVMEDQASANIQVTQLIFSGQYWIGLQLAKLGQSIRETSLTVTELDVKEQVNNSYYLILMIENMLKVLDENTNNLKEIYKHTQNMYDFGMAEQTDVDQLWINLSLLENSRKEMEQNLQLNYNMFRFVMGIETNEDIILTDKMTDLVQSVENVVLVADSFDINNNPTYQLLLTQEDMGKKQLNMQKWAYAPSVVGYYNYKEKLLTSDFDLSPKNVAGVTLSVPIFASGSKQAQLSQKKIELEKISRNKSMMEEQLALQHNQLSFELKSAYDNYTTQKDNIEVAKRVYQSYQNKYRQGMVSSLELTQANNNYLQAESNYISAAIKLLQSKLSLDKLNNRI